MAVWVRSSVECSSKPPELASVLLRRCCCSACCCSGEETEAEAEARWKRGSKSTTFGSPARADAQQQGAAVIAGGCRDIGLGWWRQCVLESIDARCSLARRRVCSAVCARPCVERIHRLRSSVTKPKQRPLSSAPTQQQPRTGGTEGAGQPGSKAGRRQDGAGCVHQAALVLVRALDRSVNKP